MSSGQGVRVLVIAPWPPPHGGIATWSVMLHDYSQTQDSAHLKFISTAHVGMKVSGRTLRDRILRQGLGMIRVSWAVLSHLRSRSLDVVHVTGTGQLGILRDVIVLLMSRAFNVPTVYHLRFGRIPDIASRRTLEWRALVLALKQATLVLVIDEATEAVIREFLPVVTVCRVPNPVRVDSLGRPGPFGQVVVFAGWVTTAKGVEELFRAWERVAREYPSWRLELVGPVDEDYRSHLESTFSLPRVTFSGEMSHRETLQVIRNAGIFVLPSHTEGFPNVILEAMACARPIVATNVGAIPEMLRDGAGTVVPVRDAGKLGFAIASAIDDPASSVHRGIKARERVLSEYSLPRVFEEYVAIWRRVASRRSSG